MYTQRQNFSTLLFEQEPLIKLCPSQQQSCYNWLTAGKTPSLQGKHSLAPRDTARSQPFRGNQFTPVPIYQTGCSKSSSMFQGASVTKKHIKHYCTKPQLFSRENPAQEPEAVLGGRQHTLSSQGSQLQAEMIIISLS